MGTDPGRKGCGARAPVRPAVRARRL